MKCKCVYVCNCNSSRYSSKSANDYSKDKKKSWIKIKFMNVTAFNLTLIVYLNIFIFKYTLFNIMVEKYKKNHFKYQ